MTKEQMQNKFDSELRAKEDRIAFLEKKLQDKNREVEVINRSHEEEKNIIYNNFKNSDIGKMITRMTHDYLKEHLKFNFKSEGYSEIDVNVKLDDEIIKSYSFYVDNSRDVYS